MTFLASPDSERRKLGRPAERVVFSFLHVEEGASFLLMNPRPGKDMAALDAEQRVAPWPTTAPTPTDAQWILESLAGGGKLHCLTIQPLPFLIGRRPGLQLTLPSVAVSKTHAEVYAAGDGLRLRDLGSTNGTFLNDQLITDSALTEGDILHFADFEFRLGRQGQDARADPGPDEMGRTLSLRGRELPRQFPEGGRELRELIDEGAVTVVFQPIFRMSDGAIGAYEALGRGRHPRLPESPAELFRIAESLGAEGEVSRLLRHKAVELVRDRNDLPTIFLNMHPVELSRPGFLESLEELRRLAPRQDLALEIHESCLTSPAALAELGRLLSERNISLAYDDFGAGQARLLELAEAPPHYLKFDRRLVAGIDGADMLKRRRMLSALVTMARDLLVETIAEGVETAAEAEACGRIGFSHAQGYWLGRPLLPEQL
jgi:EAL domain-containing protein (putative c-di-GMP-specific phosphodiesterase class I)